MTAIWVVAIEYAGPVLEPLHPASRRPVLEHAYDLDAGCLAHGDDRLRVGFPHPTRGWPAPAQLTRCAGCSLAVTALITGIVADAVCQVATDLTRWAMRFTDVMQDDMWLSAPPPNPPDTT